VYPLASVSFNPTEKACGQRRYCKIYDQSHTMLAECFSNTSSLSLAMKSIPRESVSHSSMSPCIAQLHSYRAVMSKVCTRDTTQIRVPDFPTGPIEILLLSVSLFLLCTVPTNNASQPPVPPYPSSERSSTESSPVSIA
jgi:hypothetical protein